MDRRWTRTSQAECDRVIDAVLDVLVKVGVCMRGADALSALESRGVRVDWETGVVRISDDAVRAVLDTLPRGAVHRWCAVDEHTKSMQIRATTRVGRATEGP